ncbi:S41 family peptidase [Thermovenabulum sp.]|uniref:S41 family peptidase n=1 Tax=Thermovenabulum sp. TaxID=3100335 RepID=UPI003C7E1912
MKISGNKRIIFTVFAVTVLCVFSFYLGLSFKTMPLHTLKESNLASIEKKDEVAPLIEVMNYIKERYVKDVPDSVLVHGAIKGMVEALKDPYSVYMDNSEFEDFISSINGSFEGVGLSLGVDEKTSNIIVISPIEGTPAHRAGILPRDVIVKVDDVDLKGKSLDEAVKLLRGKKGTRVTVYIERPGVKDVLKFELIRDNIKIKTVKYQLIENNIGYIRISSFDTYTPQEMADALKYLKLKKAKALILDLRNNPGGSLDSAVKVADLLLGKGLIVYTEDKNKNRLEEFYSDENKINIPLAVLVNENSASASEIVAGAIKDFKAGIILGEKTFGKGTVQELVPLAGGAGIKLTIAKYFLPSGQSIDGKGIIPDITLKEEQNSGDFNSPLDKDTWLKKALEVIKNKISTGSY